MEMLAAALQHKKPQPERAFIESLSIPPIDSLRPK